MASPSSLHVVVFAFPVQGHIAPAMELSRKLVASGFTVTFLTTEHNFSCLQRSQANAATQDLDHHIRLVGLPDGLPLDHERNPQHYEFFQSVTSMQGVVEQLLEKLMTEEASPVRCIIYDTFLPWMKDVAIKANIPRAPFWTSSAAVYSIFLHIPLLLSNGIIPVKGESRGGSLELEEDLIDFIPGLPPLRLRDLPGAIKVEDTSDWVFQFLHDQFQQIGNDVPWVLVSSIYELEKQVVDELRGISPLYPVGPLIPLDAFESREGDGSGTKQDDCLRWLDTQRPSSVLYVSFGSVYSPSTVQMKVLATGFEASRQPFLWVIRSDAISGSAVSDVLPEDFLSRTKERGLVIPWAPQVRVLSHPSVGAFLSHCGWNSTLESVYAGIPMITWPQFAEQATNARFIVDEWKIGVRLRVKENGVLASEDVEEAIGVVMQSEEAMALRERATGLGDAMKGAVKKEGSSRKNLEAFAEDLCRGSSQSILGSS